MSSSFLIASAMPTVLLLVCEIVALVVVLTATRGGARTLAAIGIALLILVAVLQSGFASMLPWLMYRLELSSAGIGGLSAGVSTLFALILVAGLILIAFGAGRAAVERRVG